MWENLNNEMEIEKEKNGYPNWRIICAYWNILNSFSLKEILSRLSAICKFYGYS